MITRQLGELKVSEMGLGCMGMSAYYEKDHDETTSIANIQAAYQAGVTLFDTADKYGDSEILLGKALRSVFDTARDSVVIATKCGFITKANGDVGLDLSPEHIQFSCQTSLEKMGLDYIDLFYLHRLPEASDLDASLQALAELIQAGKIKYFGVSEANATEIRQIYTYFKQQGLAHHFAAVQSEFSLFTQDPLHNGVIETCRELGIGFVPYSPLARALLTPPSKLNENTVFADDDFRSILPRFQGSNFKENLSIRDRLHQLAEKKQCTLPQLALAWVLAQGDFIVPIPGTRKIKNMIDNLGAVRLHLNQADLLEIAKIVGNGAEGERYTEAMRTVQNIKF